MAVSPTPARAVDVYVEEGVHIVNGRQWRTRCEPYSKTKRCRAEIWATTIAQVNGRFVQTNGWAFNNLTYLPLPREAWAKNPLGYNGAWTGSDARKWRTECDTPATGRNACRSYIEASVIERTDGPAGASFRWVTKWVFNSQVRFAVPPPPPPPVAEPTTQAEQTIFTKTNQARSEAQRRALARDARLDTVARNWAAEMLRTDKLEHNPEFWQQIPPGWTYSAENIAVINSKTSRGETLFNYWWNTTSHRDNIVSSAFRSTGVGVACNATKCYGVQVFSG